MKKYLFILLGLFNLCNIQCFSDEESNMVLVKIGEDSTLSAILKIEKNFYISKYEVTQEEYEKVMGYNPSYFKSDKTANYPVEQVTWYDAVAYCNEKSKIEGVKEYYTMSNIRKNGNSIVDAMVTINEDSTGYRLPYQNEWIYSASGGIYAKGYSYSGGEGLKEIGWYEENIDEGVWYSENAEVRGTQPVGKKTANELGIYDMSGNVWEWCWDIYSYNKEHRVLLGGAFSSHNYNCEVTYSNGFSPYHTSLLNGFRVSKSEK